MSVLIRGMVMPERCGQCFLRVGNCKQRMYMEHRPKDCPLVEVEPHGDLTDKDKRNARIIIDALRMAKTVEPEPHWIPCSAELPKTNDPVNVTYVNHNPGNYYAEVKDKPYTATAHFHKGQWYWYSCTTQDLLDEYGTWIPDLIDKDVEITAWAELPEPFKEVTE